MNTPQPSAQTWLSAAAPTEGGQLHDICLQTHLVQASKIITYHNAIH